MSKVIVDNIIKENYIGSDIDFETYFNIKAINQSFLSKMYVSPAQAIYSLTHPDEQTEAMVFGRLIHSMVLEPELCFNPEWFENNYAVLPKGMRRDTRTAPYKEFLEKNNGKSIIKESDLDNANAMAGAIKLRIGDLIKGRAEVTMLYKGKHFDFKLRADYLSEDDCIIDLKTTRSAEPKQFLGSIEQYNYDLQAAFYCYIYNRLTGKQINEYKILAVEKEQPYISEMYVLSKETLKRGMDKLVLAINDYSKYKDMDAYSVPGYRRELI